jgi:hypothetical protein
LNTKFRTSATTKDCLFVFEWCGTGARLYKNDSRWYILPLVCTKSNNCILLFRDAAEPNNPLGGNQLCAYLDLNVGVAGKSNFMDFGCDDANRFICEVIA